MRIFFFTIIFLLQYLNLSGQTQQLVVQDIVLIGHKVTADNVIYRELDFAVGDTIPFDLLDETLELSKKRLLSTGLFNIVNYNIKEWSSANELVVEFDLKENWYIYPSVIWEYADRSFNVWWKDHRFNFNRTNYGLRADHLNLTGHKDRLSFKAQRGYTQKYELIYQYPYFMGDWGLGGSFFFSTNKEIGYKTERNITQFFTAEDESVVLRRIRAGLQLTNRSNAYAFHSIRLEYHDNTIGEQVAMELNPDYFLNGERNNQFFYLEYDFQYDHRLFPSYPEGGYMVFFNIKKEGLGIFNEYNNLSAFVGFEKYIQLAKGLVYGGRFKVKANLNRAQVGFANNTAMGYGDDVNGYELYVVDGTDYFLARTDLKYRVFERIFDISDAMPIDEFDLCPIVIWVRASLDAGYVHEPTYIASNFLANSWLIGGGPALDVLVYNNYRLSIEYNFNRLGEGGLYFGAAFNF